MPINTLLLKAENFVVKPSIIQSFVVDEIFMIISMFSVGFRIHPVWHNLGSYDFGLDNNWTSIIMSAR